MLKFKKPSSQEDFLILFVDRNGSTFNVAFNYFSPLAYTYIVWKKVVLVHPLFIYKIKDFTVISTQY